MADLQRIWTDSDPVDQQLQDPLPLGQGRLIEPRPHPLAERRQVGPDFLRRLALGAEPLLLLVLSREYMPAHANLFATLLEFVEVNRLRLVAHVWGEFTRVGGSRAKTPCFPGPARSGPLPVRKVS